MRFLPAALLFTCSVGAWAQNVSITSPAVHQDLRGTSFTAALKISNAPNACIAHWLINGESIGYARIEQTPNLSITFNPFEIGNGLDHHIQVVLLDCLQNTLATSPAVQFSIDNTTAVNSQMSVTCTTSDASPWFEMVNCTASQSGSPSNLRYGCFVDGIPVGNDNAHTTCAFPTFEFRNGRHKIILTATAKSVDGQPMVFAVWQQSVVFSNSNAHSQLRVNSREAWISPNGTYQLATPSIRNADGSTSRVVSGSYYINAVPASNRACSVNSSGLITGLAFGLCDAWVFSTNPVIASGALPAQVSPAGGSIFIGGACPGPKHPPLPFYAVLDRGPKSEVVQVVNMDCHALPTAAFAVKRGQMGTQSNAHAANASWYIPYQREMFAYVEPDNAILNFTTADTIASNWAANSMFLMSEFTAGAGYFSATCGNTNASCFEPGIPPSVLAPALNTAFNAMEFDAAPCTPGTAPCTSESAFDSAVDTYWAKTLPGYLHAGGAHLYNHTSWNPEFISPFQIFPYAVNPGGRYTIPAITYATQAAHNSGLSIGLWGPDEVDTQYGSTPFPQGLIGSQGFTRITGNGVTATVTTTVDLDVDRSYSNTFAIFGATTNSALNCSTSLRQCPGSGATQAFYKATRIGRGPSFTFPSTFRGTATSITDPELRIEPYARPWYALAPHYVPYDIWARIKSQLSAVVPPVPFSQPPFGPGLPYDAPRWMGHGSLSTFARIYNSCPPLDITPMKVSAFTVASCAALGNNTGIDVHAGLRGVWSSVSANELMDPLMGAFTTVYFPVNDLSPGIGIKSISNETVTFAVPHGIHNILPGVTRMTISGSSNPYYDTYWLIDSCPTATTCTISRRFPNTSSGSFSGVFNATFLSDGSTAEVSRVNTSTTAQAGNTISFTSPTCQTQNHRGGLFTLSGPGLPYYFTNGQHLWYARESANCRAIGGAAYFREAPTGRTGEGGVAKIMPDNNFHYGTTSIAGGPSSLRGPAQDFDAIMEVVAVGAGAIAVWPPGSNPASYFSNGTPNALVPCNAYDPPFTDSDCPTARFAGGHPFWEDGTGALPTWQALTSAYTMLQSPDVQKCLFQPRAPAPDLGLGIETTVREGPQNKCLMAVNNTDSEQSVSVPLARLQTGYPLMQLIGSWRNVQFNTLAPATSTNSITIPAGGAAFWIAPRGPAAFSEPAISVRLNDVPKAAAVGVEYSCSAYPFTQQNVELPLIASTSTGRLILPVDKHTCRVIRYRLRYLRADGAPLAESAPQTDR